MTVSRISALTAIAVTGALALTACASESKTPTTNAGNGTSASSGTSGSTGSGAVDCFTGELKPEGSSAQKNAIDEAIASYGEQCKSAKINYNSSGSGTGIKQFIAGQASWAGSDSALKTEGKNGGKSEVAQAEAACGSPAWNLPMVTGPIAIAYNLKDVGKLTLTPAVAADIFAGRVKTWNDPAIAAINSGVNLPATPIKVFFRAEESGTTENFGKYLVAAAGDKWQLNADNPKKWPGAGEGKEKSAGVAEGVKSTDGGITYVEWSYAKDNKLGIAAIDNGAGAVELTSESVGRAVASAKQVGQGNDLALKLDYATKQAGAYPIILVTYEIVCSKNKDAELGKGIKSFLKHFASADVQQGLEEIGYAPLPKEMEDKVLTAIDALS